MEQDNSQAQSFFCSFLQSLFFQCRICDFILLFPDFLIYFPFSCSSSLQFIARTYAVVKTVLLISIPS